LNTADADILELCFTAAVEEGLFKPVGKKSG
jgi:hypothetical protein